MKRGQLLGLPLLLIFALIVGAFILAYGVKVIIDLQGQANQVDFLNAMKDIEGNIDTFRNYDEGSSKVYALDVDPKLETLCFYDSSQQKNCMLDGKACPADINGILDVVLDAGYNIYVLPEGTYDQNRLKITGFQTQGGNPVCVSNGKSIVISSGKEAVGISYYAQ